MRFLDFSKITEPIGLILITKVEVLAHFSNPEEFIGWKYLKNFFLGIFLFGWSKINEHSGQNSFIKTPNLSYKVTLFQGN